MGYIRTEEEVDRMIDEMVKRTKGRYITQGVSFNKESERHLELLKMVLLQSTSFSNFVKEMLAQKELEQRTGYTPPRNHTPIYQEPIESIDVGNFV